MLTVWRMNTFAGSRRRLVTRELLAADVLDLGGEHAALERDQPRQLVLLAVVALDHDLAIEGVRDDRGGLRRDRLGQAFADEPLVAVDRDRPGLERRVRRVAEAHRAEREVVVAALALGVVEVDDLALGLVADHRDHRARALLDGHRRRVREVALADRLGRAVDRLALRLLLLLLGAGRLRDKAHALGGVGLDLGDDLDPRGRHALVDQLVAHDVRAVVGAARRIGAVGVGVALDHDRLVGVDRARA